MAIIATFAIAFMMVASSAFIFANDSNSEHDGNEFVLGTTVGEAKVIAVEGGYSITVALKDDGTVWALGDNGKGQLGIGDNTVTGSRIPVQVGGNDPLTDVIAISVGNEQTLALKSDGTVWTWGYVGYTVDSTSITRYAPEQVFSDAKAIAAGTSHCVAVKNDGTVWAWGSNFGGQLGVGSTASDVNTPTQVVKGDSSSADAYLQDAKAVAAGGNFTAVLKEDGTVWAWGTNISGQLGDGSGGAFSDKTAPVQAIGLTNVTAIAAGESFCLALMDGNVWSWGSNRYGQIGNGTSGNSEYENTPIKVLQGASVSSDAYLEDVTAIAAGNEHSLAIKDDGTAWGWGYNNYGELSDNTQLRKESPVQVILALGYGSVPITYLEDVVAIAAGTGNSIFVRSDGRVWAAGANHSGQLGDGTTSQRQVVVQSQGFITLTGTATVNITTPKVGDFMIGYFTDSNTSVTNPTHTWKADGDVVGTGQSYTIKADDLGKQITFVVTTNVERGEVASAPTSAVTAADGTFTLTYNVNGGTGSVASDTKASGQSFVVKDITGATAPAGKLFKHWNTIIDGSGTSYAPGASITASANMTLYAIWEDEVTLTYNVNGGTGSVASDTKASGQSFVVKDITGVTAPAGKVFKHWNAAADGSGTVYAPGASITLSVNTTLYAIWENNYDALITDGGASAWSSDSSEGHVITVDVDFAKFGTTGSVTVKGIIANLGTDYTAEPGSTIITFLPDFLRGLGAGTHTVIIQFDDGVAKTTLTVSGSSDDGGIDPMILIAVAVIAIVIIGAVVYLMFIRKP